jgi:hypothetical protein
MRIYDMQKAAAAAENDGTEDYILVADIAPPRPQKSAMHAVEQYVEWVPMSKKAPARGTLGHIESVQARW